MRLHSISIKRRSRSIKRRRADDGTRIVVLGNGMVSAKFCEYLIKNDLGEASSITVLGEENEPAYDRIHLSALVSAPDPSALHLHSREWYEDNGIELRTGVSVVRIDREKKQVISSAGESFAYDVLVAATGSRPFVPEAFAKEDLPGVHVYRSIRDMQGIIAAARENRSAIVIGGGLLGLEAAAACRDLGLEVTVMERSAFLMPQQLNRSASERLDQIVRDQGIEIEYLKSSTEAIAVEGQIKVGFADQSSASADMVILATGIVPNSKYAAASDIPTGVRGGIIVDDFLRSSDPDIFAIGECALLHGRIYGLAAPGYQMAAQVAAYLSGEKVRSMVPPDLSTRLKMVGADVVSIGTPLEPGNTIRFENESSYRLICVNRNGTLEGALGVGKWDDAGEIQNLYLEKIRLSKTQLHTFEETGRLTTESSALPVSAWPNSRIVCNCLTIRKGELMTCMQTCGPDPALLASQTGASTVCGSCQPLLQQLCDPNAVLAKPVAYRSLVIVSILALVATLITIFAPPPAMASSVTSLMYQIDILWRDTLIKQITGYTLLGLCLIGLLLSMRKRLKWFRFGHFARWRVFHAVFGVVALIALFAHTGFRFGDNLNFWLMLSFVGLNLLGACAGVVAAIESKGATALALQARRIRPVLTYAHLVLFWPLPALLVFHILSVYLY